MDTITNLIILFLKILFVTLSLSVFIYAPVRLYTEAECLAKGYPKYAVSVGLERYCVNLDGSVTVKVDHQK